MTNMRSIHSLLRIHTSERLPWVVGLYGMGWAAFLACLWAIVPDAAPGHTVMQGHWLGLLALQLTATGTFGVAALVYFCGLDGELSESDLQALPDELKVLACAELRRHGASPVTWSDVRSWGDAAELKATQARIEAEKRSAIQRQRLACAPDGSRHC